MAVNLLDIEWLGLIENYIETGDISKLEMKIRKDGVPAIYGNQIADLLINKLKPFTPRKRREIAIWREIEVALGYKRHIANISMMFMSKNEAEKFKKSLTNQYLAEKLFPYYSPDDARRRLNSLRKKYNRRK